MTKNEAEPYFLPAAICTLSAYVPFISFLALGKAELIIASGFLWGAGLAFWAENGRAGGNTPWPRNRQELRKMISSVGQNHRR
jgi:hypothetical protein